MQTSSTLGPVCAVCLCDAQQSVFVSYTIHNYTQIRDSFGRAGQKWRYILAHPKIMASDFHLSPPHLQPTPSPLCLYEGAAGHTQKVGPTHGQVRGRRRSTPVHLHVMPEIGPGGEALVALRAGKWLLLGVDASVADELSGHSEGLPAIRALVTFRLGVNAPVVFQGH